MEKSKKVIFILLSAILLIFLTTYGLKIKNSIHNEEYIVIDDSRFYKDTNPSFEKKFRNFVYEYDLGKTTYKGEQEFSLIPVSGQNEEGTIYTNPNTLVIAHSTSLVQNVVINTPVGDFNASFDVYSINEKEKANREVEFENNAQSGFSTGIGMEVPDNLLDKKVIFYYGCSIPYEITEGTLYNKFTKKTKTQKYVHLTNLIYRVEFKEAK